MKKSKFRYRNVELSTEALHGMRALLRISKVRGFEE